MKYREEGTLLKALRQAVDRAAHEHYHTSRLPDWPGYVISEEDMAQIRSIVGALERLGR